MTAEHRFGTFKGVYIPSVLTILGVIMYLRLGWVVGNVGLIGSILIITLASAITFVTGLSIAATATNMQVRGGGAYYMISRSFGVETGAAIGLPLYLAQAIGVSFYIAGFAESVHSLLPGVPTPWIGVVSLCGLGILAYISANLALKTQLLIFVVILSSLVSFFLGSAPQPDPMVSPTGLPRESFWVVFAVFFPAVTGIEAGISMSGDLKNPARSLPLGTILAVISGYGVYIAIAIFLYVVVPQNLLLEDSMIMRRVAVIGELILLGVWGASLSSALGALLGAPRTLQALARDHVVPNFFGKGHGASDMPRLATMLSFLIALTGIILGDLNAIAAILSMFFLTSYGFLNLAAGIEGLIGNPSWRPKFRTPWPLSLLGALSCLLVMLMINAGATIIATIFVVGVFLIMRKRRLNVGWSDMRRSMLMALARYSIYQLSQAESDPRSWQPNILVLSGSPKTRWYLIELADAMTHGKGFLTVATILTEDDVDVDRRMQMQKSIRDFLKKRAVPALVEVEVSATKIEGMQHLVNNYGLGPIAPNTVILGETEQQENYTDYVKLLMTIYRAKKNLIIVREGFEPAAQQEASIHRRDGNIDIWWGRQRQNAGLMLAVAYMVQTSSEWQGAELTLNTTVAVEDERDNATRYLNDYIAKGRVPAKVNVVVSKEDEDIFHTIRAHSSDASLLFIGMRPPEEEESVDDYCRYYQSILARTQEMPLTAIVVVAEDIKFNEIFV